MLCFEKEEERGERRGERGEGRGETTVEARSYLL